jgi:hypothetical protein
VAAWRRSAELGEGEYVAVVAAADTDGDGLLTREEFPRLARAVAEADGGDETAGCGA